MFGTTPDYSAWFGETTAEPKLAFTTQETILSDATTQGEFPAALFTTSDQFADIFPATTQSSLDFLLTTRETLPEATTESLPLAMFTTESSETLPEATSASFDFNLETTESINLKNLTTPSPLLFETTPEPILDTTDSLLDFIFATTESSPRIDETTESQFYPMQTTADYALLGGNI